MTWVLFYWMVEKCKVYNWCVPVRGAITSYQMINDVAMNPMMNEYWWIVSVHIYKA